MPDSNFKHELFSHFARIGKALGNGNRLELLEFLAQGERSVEALSKVAGLSIANTSQHLQHLRQSGLVLARKEGLRVFYRLSGDDVVNIMDNIRLLSERHIADVERLINTYLTVKDSLEPIKRAELIERVRDGLVTVVDVRPSDEFDAGHVAGAINIPIDELEQRMNELGENKEVIAYCRGPHCILAFDAVAQLREKGLNARRLEDGFPEWKTSGFPVD